MEDCVKSKLERAYHNLHINETKDYVSFKQFKKYCYHCYSKNIVENSYYTKKIVLNSMKKHYVMLNVVTVMNVKKILDDKCYS